MSDDIDDSSEPRCSWTVLGRVIGTATGWDQGGTFDLILFDFKPAEGVNIPEADSICIYFESGKVEAYLKSGEVFAERDLILALQGR